MELGLIIPVLTELRVLDMIEMSMVLWKGQIAQNKRSTIYRVDLIKNKSPYIGGFMYIINFYFKKPSV